jgi:glycosyltransferase involved in cell wall biosynthesis
VTSSKIAFIKMGSFSLVNERVCATLATQFPQHQLEIIDIDKLVKKTHPLNLFWIVCRYGWDFLSRRRDLWEEIKSREILTRTHYYFQAVRLMIARRLEKKDYLFSFQTQSLFDASCSGLPHFVYTDHTHLANLRYPHFDRRKLYPKSWITREKEIYHNATLIFTTSNFVSQSLIEDYGCPPEKVVCVYSGINLDRRFRPSDKQYFAKEILFVGKDWLRKGGPDLIEAFLQVQRMFPDVRLTIVGCRPDVDIPGCEVVGFVPSEDLWLYYSRASVFCLPSKVEPSAAVLAEAAAHALAVVSTNVGGTPDRVIHGESGYLITAGRVDELTSALIDLLGDREKCERFGKKGYELTCERFSWERVGEKMKESIETAINAHSQDP